MINLNSILATFPEWGQKVPPLSLFGGEKRHHMCMMIKDSIDDEKVSRQKQFDRFCYYVGGVKQLLDKKAA